MNKNTTRKPIKKTASKRRLKTPSDVQRYCSFLINRLDGELLDAKGKIKLEVVAKITSLSKVLLQAMDADFQQTTVWELEQRIQVLESKGVL